MTNTNLYYSGSTSYCELSDHSCRKIGVPTGSSFSLLDPYHIVYQPCKTGGRDNTGVGITEYTLIQRAE